MIVRTPRDVQNLQFSNNKENKNNNQTNNQIEKTIQECIDRSSLQIDVLEQIRARSKDRKSSQKTTGRTTRRYEEQNQNQLIQNQLTKPIKLDFQLEDQENILVTHEQIQGKQSEFQLSLKDLDQMFEETITKSRQITQKFNFIR
ncbi:unnamed protein product (macronuclear) [Paramecium tetraurelia]|uniref:t-SNARE coiled-coil homology domain-containing protein n=1 Tax=Paramecium tetraurelia TaxID=5888 RepID=A0DQN3_PARTE|nr:uncharacterized protein GSPATT00002750001 [Paramecium tetraurelia]CAK85350.1 unnamed protein product [Paramecium tetraurelia]|eukprot:XP_001452747.1 hypothetical protein (macronuclear) [Paramecium tetraurelia strain d4-2]